MVERNVRNDKNGTGVARGNHVRKIGTDILRSFLNNGIVAASSALACFKIVLIDGINNEILKFMKARRR